MAFNTTIDQATRITIDLGGRVNAELRAFSAVRSRERAANEARFYELVADQGLSYADQLDIRQDMLARELDKASPDNEYISNLRKNIAEIRKLRRFEEIREDYLDSYDQLIAGKKNLREHQDFLESQLEDTTDPELRTELRQELSRIREQVTQEEVNTLKNRITVAEKDGTVSTLKDIIKDVKKRRGFAKSNGNDEEVSMWDISLTSLNQQLGQVEIANKVHDINFNIERNGMGAMEKLDELNNNIADADDGAPVTINGTNYTSAKDFWTQTRNAYLSGQGSVLGFGNFFSEIEGEVKAKVDTVGAVNSFGMVPLSTLDAIANDYKELSTREEFEPFAEKLQQSQIAALSYGTGAAATAVTESAVQTLQAQSGINLLSFFESRFGVNLTAQKFDLGNKVLAAGGQLESKAQNAATIDQVGGQSPQDIPGQTPIDIFGRATDPTQQNEPQQTQPQQNVPTNQQPQTTVKNEPPKAQTTQPETPSTPPTNNLPQLGSSQGFNSIVDFLSSQGQASDFGSRAQLFEDAGLGKKDEFQGRAEQNVALLDLFR